MKRCIVLAGVALMAFASLAVQAQEAKKVDLKCPVSGKAAKTEHALEHNGGQVYFCCDQCPKAFKTDTAKYAAKANAQLVASGQATEVKCPLTGKDLNPEAKSTVADVEVKFCCKNCKAKVDAAKGDEQLNLVFSDAAFKKGFEVKKAEKK
jgi:YHS domain-containing protein